MGETDEGRSTRFTRRSFVGLAAAGLVGAVAACTNDGSPDGNQQAVVSFLDEPGATTVLPAGDPARIASTLSAAIFETAHVAVVATEDTAEALAALATTARLPLLIGTDQSVLDELSRLETATVVTADGTDLSALGDDVEILEVDPAAEDSAGTLPDVSIDETPSTAALLLDPDQEAELDSVVARALVEAAGGTVAELPGGDPRISGDSITAAQEAAGEDPATGVFALGESFGDAEQLTARLTTAVTAPQLPGGGQIAFPHRRMIAAYGTPGSASLGILGEQDLSATIERVPQLAADYEPHSDTPVQPAFEIITTIASSEPGGDGDHSSELSVETLREWVDGAGEAGVYVVLDLQPGTTDFLTQARMYEELLLQPHVGLALDPEWRLEPGQRHMEQIGSVTAAEVNEVITWLADLTAENSLPQKVLILHQFRLSMISDRQDLDTSREELAITLHADGNGAPGDKLATWNSLQTDLPEGIFMAWKNFYDEDSPTFTPEETYAVEPRPWFVSYQ